MHVYDCCSRPPCPKTLLLVVETSDRTKESTDAPLETIGEVNGPLGQMWATGNTHLNAHLCKPARGSPHLNTKRQFGLLEKMLRES